MWNRGLCVAALCGAFTAPALADQLNLTGTVRDFKRGDWTGGHPDFQTAGSMNRFGHVTGLVTMNLSEDGKPVFNPTRPSTDTIKNANSFNQWYRDTTDVNQSMPLTLTLDNGQSAPGGVYTYQSNAFWPINSKMFGNQSLDKNFHFTFELHTDFTYQPGQYFTFVGDDDVWVYINGLRVIDLGGVHSAIEGSVLLFDGKAFVDKNDFPLSSTVIKVSSTLASQLKSKWTALGLPGTCPIVKDDRYIDLGLLPEGGAEARAVFPSATSAQVWATKTLSAVTLKFADYSEQVITNVSGTTGTFSGSGANSGKSVVGVWIKTTSDPVASKGQYIAPQGVDGESCTLDFFFAERHTTQSNFRIDTSIQMISAPLNTISPSYD